MANLSRVYKRLIVATTDRDSTNACLLVKSSAGPIEHVPIREVIGESLVALVYAPERYFAVGPGTTAVPIANLVASRARPHGIKNANRLMQQAYRGEIARRAPVSIAPYRDGLWLVIDGNSTLINAIASRWPDLPCDKVSKLG